MLLLLLCYRAASLLEACPSHQQPCGRKDAVGATSLIALQSQPGRFSHLCWLALRDAYVPVPPIQA